MAESTRTSLLRRLRDPSDQDAWRAFEARYGDLILRYGLRRGLAPADAEDVRQMTFLGLAGAMRTFRYDPELGTFRGYLGRVVQNAVARLRATSAGRPIPLEPAALEELARDGAEEDATWEREWVAHHYRLALEGIRADVDPQSLAIFERILAGDPVDAVAAAFGSSAAAVQKVKQRIRARLEARIAQQIADEDASGTGP